MAARRFRLARPEPPESAIQDAVLRFLALDARVAWAHRFNTGAMRIPQADANGRSCGHRFVRFAFPGCSDVLGQLASGHLLAVEVKRPSTKPTPAQAEFLRTVGVAGGLAVVARSVDDVQQAIDGFFAEQEASRAELGREAAHTRVKQDIDCAGVHADGTSALPPGRPARRQY